MGEISAWEEIRFDQNREYVPLPSKFKTPKIRRFQNGAFQSLLAKAEQNGYRVTLSLESYGTEGKCRGFILIEHDETIMGVLYLDGVYTP